MPETLTIDGNTITVPHNDEELGTLLSDKSALTKIGGEPGNWRQLMTAYAENFKDKDKGDTEAQKQQQLSETIKKYLEENGYVKQKRGRVAMTEEVAAKGWSPYNASDVFRKAHVYNPEAPGVYEEGAWKHLGEFLQHAINSLKTGIADAQLKDMSEAIGGDGGFLVPEEFRAELLRLSLEMSVVRPRARVIPMTTAVLRFPSIRDTDHSSTVFGGISGTWKAETASLNTVVQPTFSQVKIEPYKLTAWSRATNELLSDSAIGLEALIGQLFPEAIAYFEDDAFINGTGVGQPLGVKNADALVSVAKETGQAADTIDYVNLIKMYSRMLPSSLSRAVWVAHPDTLPQLAQMSLAVGTGGSAVWVMNASQSVPMSIFGRPLIFSEKMQTIGDAFDIAFVDFGQYLIGDRQALAMARSEHSRFSTDEIEWRFTQRVDGRPWLTSALTPRNGTNSFSPYVSLAVRG